MTTQAPHKPHNPVIAPTRKQHAAWQLLGDDATLFVFFGGGAGGGKSWLSAEWLLTNCYALPGSRWFVGRKELKRLRQSWYVTFRKVCRHHGIPAADWKYNGQDHYIDFFNGSRVELLDLKELPSDPLYERFGSLEYTGGAIEEGGEVPFMAFDVLKTRIGRHQNAERGVAPKMLVTCNPNKGWIYRVVYKRWKDRELPQEYAFVQALYRDNPHAREQYARVLDQIQDPVMRSRLKEGVWEYEAGEGSLIEYDAMLDLFTNAGVEGEKYLTADVARFGRDSTVILLWRGYVVYKVLAYEKTSNVDVEQVIKRLCAEEGIARSRVAVDETGVGGGIVDHLPGVVGFVAGAAAMPNPRTREKENYRNLRAQCSYMLAAKVNTREIAIVADLSERDKELIIADLEQIKGKDVERDAPLQVIPKEEVKEILGRSPDYGDAMMMRMVFDLERKREPRVRVLGG